MTDNNRLTTEQAAEYLGFATGTLQNWRQADKSRKPEDRQGPPYYKMGKVFYTKTDLDKWISENRVQ